MPPASPRARRSSPRRRRARRNSSRPNSRTPGCAPRACASPAKLPGRDSRSPSSARSTLPNPGGGADLLENATATLAPGHRYGLIGRNGKGKSTLLKFLASRRVPGFDPSTTVHYVSQEVSLTQEQEGVQPAALVVEADVERRLLLEEAAALTAKTENRAPDANEARSSRETHELLLAIDAEGAPGRAAALLHNLGFGGARRARDARAERRVARVRAALAAALFAKPDVLLTSPRTICPSRRCCGWPGSCPPRTRGSRA